MSLRGRQAVAIPQIDSKPMQAPFGKGDSKTVEMPEGQRGLLPPLRRASPRATEGLRKSSERSE